MGVQRYAGVVYRPPSEADSLILQITFGCAHNACTFCDMYRHVRFRVRTLEEIKQDIAYAKRYYRNVEKIFLADGDALVLSTERLLEIIHLIYQEFPKLRHVGIYACPKDVLAKSVEELKELRDAGLTLVYLGVETGDEVLLQEINKGVNVVQMIEAGQKVRQAGIKLSVTVILGLGGKSKSFEHAVGTAKVLNAIQPDYVGALTLLIQPGTPLARQVNSGRFETLLPHEVLEELYQLILHIDVQNPCIFRSNHASNYLAVGGTLPEDKQGMLDALRAVMGKDEVRFLRPESWRVL